MLRSTTNSSFFIRLILYSALQLWCELCSAQTDTTADDLEKIAKPMKQKIYRRVFIHNHGGVLLTNFSNLNSILSRNALIELSPIQLTRGGGNYTIFPKYRLALLTTYVTYTQSRFKANQAYYIRGNLIGSTIGYTVFEETDKQIIPFVGLAYSSVRLRLSVNNNARPDMEEYLKTDNLQYNIFQWGIAGNVGVHFGRSHIFSGMFGELITMGCRLGYAFPINMTPWLTDGKNISRYPKVNSQGFYSSIFVGLAI